MQGWGAGAGCFWHLGTGAGAAWKKNQEPELEPLGKTSGAGAAKLYFSYSSLGNIVNFYGLLNSYFFLFIFFAVLLTSLRGKEYFTKLDQ